MTKWKWALALRLPVKVLVVNENGDFFWFDRANWRTIRHFVLFRAGLSRRRRRAHHRPHSGLPADPGLSSALRGDDSSPQKGPRMKAIQVHDARRPGAVAAGRYPRAVPGRGPGAGQDRRHRRQLHRHLLPHRPVQVGRCPSPSAWRPPASSKSVGPDVTRRGRGRPGGLLHGAWLLRRVRRRPRLAAGQDPRRHRSSTSPPPPCSRA